MESLDKIRKFKAYYDKPGKQFSVPKLAKIYLSAEKWELWTFELGP